jgi:hypothetical protein
MLGVASSLVAVAALTIVFAGHGEAQGANGPNVTVVNTPLPVTGNITATIPGNVSATIVNASDSPVLIRDVDRQGAKELWQEHRNTVIADGATLGVLVFPTVPAGKALVIEHVNMLFQNLDPTSIHAPNLFSISNTDAFNESTSGEDFQYMVPEQSHIFFIADATSKLYVGPGQSLRAIATRSDTTGQAFTTVRATGYLVDHP